MSNAERVTIYIPCDVVAIRVRLGFADTLTPTEKIILKAVHAGAATLGELAAMLGLPQRMLVDFAQDLWKAGYLMVIRSKAGVRVSAEVERHIEAGTLDKLASAEVVDTTRNLMVDKLTNEIRPVTGPKTPVQRRFAVPVENSPTRLADLTTADLLAAMERDLAHEARRRKRVDGSGNREQTGFAREQRVISAHLSPAGLESVGRRWLPVEVRPAIDPMDEALTVTVVDAAFSQAQRAAIEEQLGRLVAARPQDDFFRALRGQAPPGLAEAPSLAEAAARLREQAVAAATIPAGQRRNWHLSLLDLDRRLDAQLNELAGREVTATAVVGDRHTDALVELIGKARAQLVITAPWISYDGLSAVLPALRLALQRGVDVFLLWGISHDQVLEGRVSGLLYDTTLRSASGPSVGRLHVPGTASHNRVLSASGDDTIAGSSRTHAKVAVADADLALITSWNMLNRPDASQEVGVLLADARGGPSRAVRDVLRWARSIVPDYRTSGLVLVTEQDFALREGTSRPQRDRPARRSGLPEVHRRVPPSEPDDGEGQASANAAKGWSKAWVDHADRLAAEVAARTTADARIVVDGTHRDLLKQAVRSATFRLAITSDQLSDQVVDDRFVAALRATLERGVEVAVRYARPHRDDVRAPDSNGSPAPPPPTRAESALAVLRADFPGLCTVERVKLHAKVLLWDDEVVVGSFNFLSFEGFFTSGPTHRRRSEVSARITSRALTDELAAVIGLVRPRPARTELPPAPAAQGAYLTVQLILNDVAAGVEHATAVAKHLVPVTDPWPVLERLAEDADRGLLRVAAATCLSLDGAAATRSGRTRWVRWLVEDLWSDGRYVEALVLRRLVDDETARPRLALAALAAARGGAVYPKALHNALSLLDDSTGGTPQHRVAEAAVLLAAAVEQVLWSGGVDARDNLELVLSEVVDDASGDELGIRPWKELGEAVHRYAVDSYAIPVPIEAIRLELARRQDFDTRDRAWARLRTTLDRAEHTHFENTASLRTHLHLFNGADGVFTRLKDVVAERRTASLSLWVADPALRDVGALIDAAAAVAAPGVEPMYGTYRKRYTKLLESVIREARAVVVGLADFADDGGPDIETARLLEVARPLAEAVARGRADLVAQADNSAEVEAGFLVTVAESFDELAAWAEKEAGRV
ncbi:hypothetical protein ACFFSW_07540 [Saccharothrix longispora]|uniref:Phosphatidylserine/phosphatidylglycerophosphate/ cardiolipin synthase-like enzyme n=1 Tax=Saccharothrix longispora TaxID=33920 RepID=A0ABU1PPI6_9PSEU|nr:hypothetical protein [Saccharothrix longispora]MDR6591794.1 phosphatidylserine/phosphatidylglycerophosphate/cardiolipin synthase-like enzyme [Saccharothrix longispora]